MRGHTTVANTTMESIIQKSVWNNARSDVSGMMCYDVPLKQVWQVVEGSEESVKALWDKIGKDQRHAIDWDSISIEEVDSRRYPKGWGMRYSRFGQLDGDAPEVQKAGGDLLQVKYKSFIKSHGGGEATMMEGLVERAIIKNAQLGITGWLLYNDRTLTVYQVLEGPTAVVEKLIDAIIKDPRHEVSLASVQRKVIEKREFPHWSMSLDKIQMATWSVGAAY